MQVHIPSYPRPSAVRVDSTQTGRYVHIAPNPLLDGQFDG